MIRGHLKWCLGLLALISSSIIYASKVYDQANIFTDNGEASLSQYHQRLLEKHDIDYRILTTTTEENLSLYTNQAFRQLHIGTSSKTGRGLLLVLDPVQNQVRVEVSTSLEPIYTDSFIAYLQTRQMVPYFAKGHILTGILATSEMIFTRAQEAERGMEFLPPSRATSVGGGAQTAANIGAGQQAIANYKSRKTVRVNTNNLTPTEIVGLYHQAMKNRDARSDLDIYSKATRETMKHWVMTAAQMDNIAKTFSSCEQDKERILLKLAVVRYRVEQRQCSPYFLIFEEEAWRLDLASMTSLIGFNHNNEWHLMPGVYNYYGFGFGDWTFDEYRYPHPLNAKKLRWKMSVITMYDKKTYVDWVKPGGAAYRLGFRYGDQIVSWMGQTVINHDRVFPLMNQSRPGEKIWAVIHRGGVPVRLNGIMPP